MEKIGVDEVKGYFNDPMAVLHYLKAVANVGLWDSEEQLFLKYFKKSDSLLDLGCGAGRVAFGLWKLGFRRILGLDLAEGMIQAAKEIALSLQAEIAFETGDARRLPFEAKSFDGVVFGFNGLMQIPLRENRREALLEVRRILKPGGRFIFTTLDRGSPLYTRIFSDGENPEHDPDSNSGVIEMGDRHFKTDHGTTFMHVPDRNEVLEDLAFAGLSLVEDGMRSGISEETERVRSFSEDCRFWVVER